MKIEKINLKDIIQSEPNIESEFKLNENKQCAIPVIKNNEDDIKLKNLIPKHMQICEDC